MLLPVTVAVLYVLQCVSASGCFMFKCNPLLDSSVPADIPAPHGDPVVRWTLPFGSQSCSSDGYSATCVTTQTSGRLIAQITPAGTVSWNISLGPGPVEQPPPLMTPASTTLIAEGRVLRYLDTVTGDFIWETDLTATAVAHPSSFTDSGLLVILSLNGVVAVYEQPGNCWAAVQLRLQSDGPLYLPVAAPAVRGERIYLVAETGDRTNSALVAVDVTGGSAERTKTSFLFTAKGLQGFPVLVGNNTLLLHTNSQVMAVLDNGTAVELLWQSPLVSNQLVFGCADPRGGHWFLNGTDNYTELVRLDSRTGKKLQTLAVPFFQPVGDAIIFQGQAPSLCVCALNHDSKQHELILLDLTTGDQVWHTAPGCTGSLTVLRNASETLVLIGTTSSLVAIGA